MSDSLVPAFAMIMNASATNRRGPPIDWNPRLRDAFFEFMDHSESAYEIVKHAYRRQKKLLRQENERQKMTDLRLLKKSLRTSKKYYRHRPDPKRPILHLHLEIEKMCRAYKRDVLDVLVKWKEEGTPIELEYLLLAEKSEWTRTVVHVMMGAAIQEDVVVKPAINREGLPPSS